MIFFYFSEQGIAAKFWGGSQTYFTICYQLKQPIYLKLSFNIEDTDLVSNIFLQAAFTEASESLFKALEGQIYFSSIDILVPQNWTALDCQTPLNLHRASGRQVKGIYQL